MTHHFEATVSPALQVKVLEIAEEALEQVVTCLGEGHGCDMMAPISGVPYPGFFPSQRGGYEASEFIRFDGDTSYHITDAMTAEYERQYESFAACMLEEQGINLTSDWDGMTEAQQETVNDAECEWFEPALLRFEVWVGTEDKIYMRLSINYSDAPYYRATSDTTLLETTIDADTEDSAEAIVKAFDLDLTTALQGE